ncbi:MAG: ATP-binding protein [Thermoplasmata archaeon]
MGARTPTVKERILLHLYPRRSTSAYEAPPEISQRGIALAVGIRLRHVSQYVKPLLNQGLVEHHSTHVRGRRRRQLAYVLTPLGRGQAEALRRTLMGQTFPVRRRDGRIEDLPLARIYHEERRGATVLELLQEFKAVGYVSESSGEEEGGESAPVDFAPEVAGDDLFFGRERELGEVADSLDRSPLTVVWGIAGIGKTTLGAKVCDNLRGERSLFWHRIRPWDGAMDLALDLAGFLRAQGRTELLAYLGRRGAENLTRIGEVLATDLDGTRALLVLDDAHKASAEAKRFLSVLSEALQRQSDASALVLTREVPDFYTRDSVSLDGTVTEFLLKGLEPQSGAALLSKAGIGETQLDELLTQSGGNPLFLKLLAKGALKTGSRGTWSSLETYIAREVEPFLKEEERDCLEIASFYEIPIPREGLLLGRSGGFRTIVSLLSKALLEEVKGARFQAHDVLKRYFQGGMPRDRGKELRDKVVPWLLGQTSAATERGEWGGAVSLVENALMFETDSKRRLDSLQRLGGLRTSIGDASGGGGSLSRCDGGSD